MLGFDDVVVFGCISFEFILYCFLWIVFLILIFSFVFSDVEVLLGFKIGDFDGCSCDGMFCVCVEICFFDISIIGVMLGCWGCIIIWEVVVFLIVIFFIVGERGWGRFVVIILFVFWIEIFLFSFNVIGWWECKELLIIVVVLCRGVIDDGISFVIILFCLGIIGEFVGISVVLIGLMFFVLLLLIELKLFIILLFKLSEMVLVGLLEFSLFSVWIVIKLMDFLKGFIIGKLFVFFISFFFGFVVLFLVRLFINFYMLIVLWLFFEVCECSWCLFFEICWKLVFFVSCEVFVFWVLFICLEIFDFVGGGILGRLWLNFDYVFVIIFLWILRFFNFL